MTSAEKLRISKLAGQYKCPPWFQTYTGRKFNPKTATAASICIEDIAHALSNYCRFGGHCKHFYSVAQHCCLCHDHVIDLNVIRLQTLLHDATESYMGDVVKPLKLMLPDYRRIEKRLERVIMQAFNLPLTLLPQVKHVDLVALATERRDLLKEGPEWTQLIGVKPWTERIVPWAPAVAKEQFLGRFYALSFVPLR